MIQNQQFTWLIKNPENPKQLIRKHYLLMPNEVDEFKRLTGEGIEFSTHKAFTRLTGKIVDGMIDLKLEVIIHLNVE